jgi:hypothetical protein
MMDRVAPSAATATTIGEAAQLLRRRDPIAVSLSEFEPIPGVGGHDCRARVTLHRQRGEEHTDDAKSALTKISLAQAIGPITYIEGIGACASGS